MKKLLLATTDSTVQSAIRRIASSRFEFVLGPGLSTPQEVAQIPTGASPAIVVTDAAHLIAVASRWPLVRTLGIFDPREPSDIHRLVLHGCRGLVESNATPAVLSAALRAVACGQRFASQEALRALSSLVGGIPRAASLDPSEIRIIQLLADGARTSEIAGLLHLHPNTVKAQVRRSVVKLGAAGRVSVVSACLRQGLIS